MTDPDESQEMLKAVTAVPRHVGVYPFVTPLRSRSLFFVARDPVNIIVR
jgi:hypothetical protein